MNIRATILLIAGLMIAVSTGDDSVVLTTSKGDREFFTMNNGVALTWENATKFCEERGMQLATIESAEQNAKISTLLKEGDHFWIAANTTDLKEEFKWKYSRKSLSYANWAPGEPNHTFNVNYKEEDKCVEIFKRKSDIAMWNDDPCSTPKRPLCEGEIW